LSEGLTPEQLEEAASSSPGDPLTRVTDIMAAVGTVWTFLLMLLIVADVVGRSFLSRPIVGVAEVAGQSVVAIVFLQLAAAIRQRRMTRADFLIDPLVRKSPGVGRVIEAAFSVLGAVVLAGTQFFGVPGVFTIPTWPFRMIIFAGSIMAAIAYMAMAVDELRLSRQPAGTAP
jgi:TRAP-type C4-dicarboxylate transport system permease small subunit